MGMFSSVAVLLPGDRISAMNNMPEDDVYINNNY